MNNLKKVLSAIVILLVITSCSNNNETKKDNILKGIQDKWITKGYTGDIFKYTSDNKIIKYGQTEGIRTYTISDSMIQYIDENNKIYYQEKIINSTDSNLTVISYGSDSLSSNEKDVLRLVSDKDFLISSWYGEIKGSPINVSFNNNKLFANSLEFNVNGTSNIINLNNDGSAVMYDKNLNPTDSFEYQLSNNKTNLILKKNGEIIYDINAMYSNPKLNEIRETIVYEEFTLNKLLNINSETDLIHLFGGKVLSSTESYYNEETGEESIYPTSTIFPKTPNEVIFNWKYSYNDLSSITILNPKGVWKTSDELKIGLSLTELEKINTNPFTFYGFDMDGIPVGYVDDFQDGVLNSKNIQIEFNYTSELSGIGYETILSNTDIAQKANPIIGSITLIVKQ